MTLEEALKRIEDLERQLAAAQQRIAELERLVARQAAPFRRREAKRVPPEQKKSAGNKPGHRGTFRHVPEHVDQQIEVPLHDCPHCHGAVQDCQPLVQYIEEIPPLRPVVTRLTTYRGQCAQCGEVHSTHPLQTSRAQGAAQTQLGPRAQAWAVLLNKQLGLTLRCTRRVLTQLVGLSVSPGGLSQAIARVARKVAGDYQRLGQELRSRSAVYADETSWWVGGPKWWLWVFTTPQETLYRVDRSRGAQVVAETLGAEFSGVLVSDCLATYDPSPYRKHKCIAHHLRAIHEARDSPEGRASSYLQQWKTLFQTVITLHGLRPQLPVAFFAQRRAGVQAWLTKLLATPCRDGGEARIRNRLAKHVPDLLRCLDEPEVEPTNNRAERALRPAVIARKLSCGNKTDAGRQVWQILVSLAATCQQRAEDFVDFLVHRITLAPQAG